MGIEYTTAGGVRKHFGTREVEDRAVAKHSTDGEVQELTVVFNYDDLPGAYNGGDDAVNAYVPANSLILDAYSYDTAAFDSTSGTTTVDVGLEEADGTEIDNDGLLDDAYTADGSAEGWAVGAGALVGTGIGTADGYVVVTPSVDDLTAGSAKVVVRYIRNT